MLAVVAVVAAFVTIVLIGAANAGGLWAAYSGHLPDLATDKYTAIAAFDSDAYMPLDELSELYGLDQAGYSASAPRTPAGLVLQLPLIAVPDGALLWFGAVGMLFMFLFIGWVAVQMGADMRFVAFFGLVFVLTPWFAQGIAYSNVGQLAAPAIAAGWWLHARRPRLAGSLFGIAAAVKLWPGTIVLSLIIRKDTRLVALWAAGTGAALTFAGLMFPGVTLSGLYGSLRGAIDGFAESTRNVSLTFHLGVPGVVAGLAVLLWSLRGSTQRTIGGAIASGLILSPIVWPLYWSALFPAVAWLRKEPMFLDKVVDEELLEGSSPDSAVDLNSTTKRLGRHRRDT